MLTCPSPPDFVYTLKNQVGDSEGLGGKLDAGDKKTILDEIKKSQTWLEENGPSASAEDFDEQREALQAVVSPITSKLYQGGAPGGGADEPLGTHDEL